MDLAFWLTSLAIILLLALSALFSGSETALTATSRARMHGLEQEGNKRAARVNRLRERKERMIGALLLGNNAVNVLASALATSVLIELFGDSGVFYATLGMTFLILIFAEVLPKTYAFNFADRTALNVAPLIEMLVKIFGPVTATVEALVEWILRRLGHDLRTPPAEAYEEELRGAIELHRGTDQNEDDEEEEERREERAMLRSILDLNNVDVSEIMTHRRNLVMIDASLPPAEIVETVLSSRFTRLPVWQDEVDNIVGVLHAKALLREVQAASGDLSGLDILTIAAKPWFIPDTTTLFDQLQAFRQRREHFALVIDEYGSLMGVVTLEDILEEIVGDIADEHDVAVAGVRPEPGGTFVVDGWVTIRDLNREFEWRLPDNKASTIAGLVLNEARQIPQVGQIFNFYDFRFEILSRQRHQITSLRVTPPERPDDKAKVKGPLLALEGPKTGEPAEADPSTVAGSGNDQDGPAPS